MMFEKHTLKTLVIISDSYQKSLCDIYNAVQI